MADSPAGYIRRLTLFDALMAVIGGIIGGGIFRNPAIVAQRAHTPGFILTVWAIGGGIAVLGALCFAELGARRPHAGGGYVYLKETFGSLPAFVYGWTFLLVVSTGSIAAVAVTFAGYTASLLHAPDNAILPLAIGAIVFLSAVNYIGTKAGAVTQNIATVLKLSALAALIVAGLVFAGTVPAAAALTATPTAAETHGTLWILGVSLVPAVFTYGGWAYLNNVAGEIIKPERNFPRAMIFGIGTVVVVYLLANVAYLRILGPEGLAASTAPASDAMRAIFGPAGATGIALGIAVSTFGFVNIVILSSPRMLQAMAADGLFFKSVAALHPRFHTPHRAILVQAVWAILLTISGTYGQLLDYVTFGDWLFFLGIVGALFIYRRRDAASGTSDGGYRAPGYPVVPALFFLISGGIVVSTVLSSPRNALMGLIIVLAGIPVYLMWNRWGMPRPVAGASSS